MNAVLLDKSRVKQSFSAASGTYDGVAQLQRIVGIDLLREAGTIQLSGTILDLGCGTGFLTEQLLTLQSNLDGIIALDLAWAMIQTSRNKHSATDLEKNHRKINYVCADAEHLPFAVQTLNGIFSNLALQWCNDLDGVLTGIKRILKPGCPLVFSTFGPATLNELKNAWAEVDDYSHVNEFVDERQIGQFLAQAGFSAIQITRKLHVASYSSVNLLMQELKKIGAHNVSDQRNKRLTTKTQMQNMIAAYDKHRSGNEIPATFEVIKVIAKS